MSPLPPCSTIKGCWEWYSNLLTGLFFSTLAPTVLPPHRRQIRPHSKSDYIRTCVYVQSCPTLCDPLDCNLPGSSVHGILQARILEWVAISSFRGFSWPRNWTCISFYSWIGKWILLPLRHLGSPKSDHIMPLMKALWWLPIGLRIKPRVLIILVNKAFHSPTLLTSPFISVSMYSSHTSLISLDSPLPQDLCIWDLKSGGEVHVGLFHAKS